MMSWSNMFFVSIIGYSTSLFQSKNEKIDVIKPFAGLQKEFLIHSGHSGDILIWDSLSFNPLWM